MCFTIDFSVMLHCLIAFSVVIDFIVCKVVTIEYRKQMLWYGANYEWLLEYMSYFVWSKQTPIPYGEITGSRRLILCFNAMFQNIFFMFSKCHVSNSPHKHVHIYSYARWVKQISSSLNLIIGSRYIHPFPKWTEYNRISHFFIAI